MNTIECETITADARARLEVLRGITAEVLREREQLMLTATAELAAVGIDATIIRGPRAGVYEPGEIVRCHRTVIVAPDGRSWVETVLRGMTYAPKNPRRPGPYALDGYDFGFGWPRDVLLIEMGKHEVLLRDGDQYLAVPIDHPDSEVNHARSVARVRAMARAEGMRISARDREISVLCPTGEVVHVGTVNTAAAWLVGVDPSLVADGEPS